MADDFVLLVEGDKDKRTIEQILRVYGMYGTITVVDEKGIDRLKTSLKARLKIARGDTNSAAKRIGVIVDADTKPSDRWLSLRNILLENGYAREQPLTDKTPKIGGTIVAQANLPKVGIWIMPDNQSEGAIEDFIKSIRAENDTLWVRAEDSVNAIPEDERLFKSAIKKAYLYTWLAWQEEPGMSLVMAFNAHRLKTDADPAKNLMIWLQELYR